MSYLNIIKDELKADEVKVSMNAGGATELTADGQIVLSTLNRAAFIRFAELMNTSLFKISVELAMPITLSGGNIYLWDEKGKRCFGNKVQLVKYLIKW